MTTQTTQNSTSDTIVAVTITNARVPHVARLIATCGDTFRYEAHMDVRDGTAIRVGCLCRHGHGVSRSPWRGWVKTTDAKLALTDIPTPISSYAPLTDAEIAAAHEQHDDAKVITLDQVGTPVPADRVALAA